MPGTMKDLRRYVQNAKGEFVMRTLSELTGRESGIVLYENGNSHEGVCLNWSTVNGLPRLDPMGFGFLGLGEDIPETAPVHENIEGLVESVKFYSQTDEIDFPQAGDVYRFDINGESIIVITPDGWT